MAEQQSSEGRKSLTCPGLKEGRDRQGLNNGDWHAMLRSLNFIPDVTIIYWRRDMIPDLQIEGLGFSYSNLEIQLKKL